MNHAAMNGMNPAAMAAMSNGQAQAAAAAAAAIGGGPPRGPSDPDREAEMKMKLNTYIYDYMIKNEQWDVARALHGSSMPHSTVNKAAARRPNGIDDGSGDVDSKDGIEAKKPADLPLAGDVPPSTSDNSFLLDWFAIFWDIFLAPRHAAKGKPGQTPAQQFMEQSRVRFHPHPPRPLQAPAALWAPRRRSDVTSRLTVFAAAAVAHARCRAGAAPAPAEHGAGPDAAKYEHDANGPAERGRGYGHEQ